MNSNHALSGVPALVIGADRGENLPGKNMLNVLGRPLCEYPMLAATQSSTVERLYVSTDSEQIKAVGLHYDCKLIERPPELTQCNTTAEDVFTFSYQAILSDYAKEERKPEMVVLLMCNAATITPGLIDAGVNELRANPEADSTITVSEYNMWSPIRARRINADGYLDPYIPFDQLEGLGEINCDRDSQGDVYFHDIGASVVRSHCLDNIAAGMAPMRWMGQHILPIYNWGGLDLDFPWQIGMVEFWLREHGIKYKGMGN